jgi:hypothetical protein
MNKPEGKKTTIRRYLMTLNIITLTMKGFIATLTIMGFFEMTFGITTLSIMTFIKNCDNQHK